MATILNDPERRTVPRWRPWRDAVRLGDLDPAVKIRAPQKHNPRDLRKLLLDWEENRTLPFAGDLMGAAFASGEPKVAKQAAQLVLSTEKASKAARDLAELILAEQLGSQPTPDDPSSQTSAERIKRIQFLKHSLREFPNNALALMDLAREYVALGQPHAALKPVEMALAIAPRSRFVLRAASRFFLHLNNPERAHDILRKARAVRTDPWLLASEIAVAGKARRTSSFITKGRSILASQKFDPAHISELASAIGTLEWEAGNRRGVRRLFRQALLDPTENVVAQAGWLSRRTGHLDIDPRILETPRSYEANAWEELGGGRWSESLESAELWLLDEPFAKRPATFGSWVAASMLQSFEKAAELAKRGLATHPREFLLLNNLTFSLASLGRTAQASQIFQTIKDADIDDSNRSVYLATKGLLKFRSGFVSEGRLLYRSAVSKARDAHDTRAAVWALLYSAREEFRCEPPRAEELIKEALADFSRLSPLDRLVSTRVLEQIVESQEPGNEDLRAKASQHAINAVS